MESEFIEKLMLKYSVPTIISSLVSSIYNMIDQVFVGNSVGELENAATNIVYPLVIISVTFAMVFFLEFLKIYFVKSIEYLFRWLFFSFSYIFRNINQNIIRME